MAQDMLEKKMPIGQRSLTEVLGVKFVEDLANMCWGVLEDAYQIYLSDTNINGCCMPRIEMKILNTKNKLAIVLLIEAGLVEDLGIGHDAFIITDKGMRMIYDKLNGRSAVGL